MQTSATKNGNTLVPLMLMVLLYLILLLNLSRLSATLPETVATHFNFRGVPDGWMPRQAFLIFIAAFAALVPLFLCGIALITRILPASLINVPNREYWLSPERRRSTDRILFSHMLWLCCLMIAFMNGIFRVVVRANLSPAQQMSNKDLFLLMGAFLVALIVWIIALLRMFRKPSESSQINADVTESRR